MEITFNRSSDYSVDLNAKAKRELAQHLGITVRQMTRLAEDGELYSEHGDAIVGWLVDCEKDWTLVDEGQLDDVEFYV